MKKIVLIIVLFPCILQAQEKRSLNYFLSVGLERNFDIRITENQQQIADNNVFIGNAGYLPTIDLSSDYSGTWANILQQYPSNGTPMIQNQNVLSQTVDAGIHLNWTIFDGLAIQTNYKKLKEFQQIGKWNLQLMIENFMTELCTEYYNYIQQTIRLNNLESAVALSKERLRIVEAQYNIGSMSNLDYQQAKVDFNADSSKLIRQYELLFVSGVKLNRLMAITDLEQPVLLTDTTILLKPAFEKESIWQKTLSNNIFLSLAEKEITIQTLELKKIQSANYPYLRVNAGYGYTHNRYQASQYTKQNNIGFNYGITLGITLFDGMNRSRQQTNAKIEIENKKLEYEKLHLGLKSDFTAIWMAYQNNMELIHLEKDNLTTARETYDIAIDRYKLGTLSGIALREAQNSLLEAEERYVQTLYNTKLCEVSLLQISGQIGVYLNGSDD